MTDVWNNVSVFGPADQIERFKTECVEPEEQIYRHAQNGWSGCKCFLAIPSRGADVDPAMRSTERMWVWNFQQFTSETPFAYSFSFDTDHEFPEDFFRDLAAANPLLAFHCDCIEALDAFMGVGWFNAPDGGEEFRQDLEVPSDYWTGGGARKRTRAGEAAHSARVDRLIQAQVGRLELPSKG